jgi:uncharacterized protein YbaR (Trm112 family)
VLKGAKAAERHTKKYHTEGDYPCQQCGNMEKQYYDLKIHLNIVHGENYSATEDEADDDEQDEDDEEDDDDEDFGEPRKKKAKHVDRLQVCPYCSQEFRSNGAYGRHKKRKHFWGVFLCQTCEHRSDFARDLIKHMQDEKHDEDPAVKCPTCKEVYNIQEIRAHYEDCVLADLKAQNQKQIARMKEKGTYRKGPKIKKEKSLEKTHICDACGRTFRSGSELKTHYR